MNNAIFSPAVLQAAWQEFHATRPKTAAYPRDGKNYNREDVRRLADLMLKYAGFGWEAMAALPSIATIGGGALLGQHIGHHLSSRKETPPTKDTTLPEYLYETKKDKRRRRRYGLIGAGVGMAALPTVSDALQSDSLFVHRGSSSERP